MDFILAKNTPILCDAPTLPVSNAIEILRRDLDTVLTQKLENPGRIEIKLPQVQNYNDEGYNITVTGSTIQIMAAGSLGAIFALMAISRDFLGIQPFWFWLDALPELRATVAVKEGQYASRSYKIRFRGWFINDEVLLEGWKPKGKPEDFAWRMPMETLLRLGGNMIIPGTDTNSLRNRRLASEMGIWITHHHAEPLGAELFGRVYPDLNASYAEHGQLFQELWQDGIRGQLDYNVIWALGFRGQGDRPFWEDNPRYDTPQKRGELMSGVIREQYAMVRRQRPDAVCCINLYGEILELYRGGFLDLPKDVINVWADSGYGKMTSRRQGNHNPRIPAAPDRKGRHGVYYHASFYDLQASNHITMLPNPPDMVCRELTGVFEAGADDYLIVNCGSIRPHCYVLDLIAELWANGGADADTHRRRYIEAYYDSDARIAALLRGFSERTVQYGPHEDEKAGEELYHYPVRQMAAAWMRGELEQPLDSLIWLCGERGFSQQIKDYHAFVDKACRGWKDYLDQCGELSLKLSGALSARFYDQIQLQAAIHYTGAAGASLFCQGYEAAVRGDCPKAFTLIWRAKELYKQAVDGFEKAGHDIWKGYYDNDCLTDVRLTVQILNTLQAWLRIKGEGSDAHLWQRMYLMDERDRRIALLLYTRRPLSDDELAAQLCGFVSHSE